MENMVNGSKVIPNVSELILDEGTKQRTTSDIFKPIFDRTKRLRATFDVPWLSYSSEADL
jgi:hypothetical protein